MISQTEFEILDSRIELVTGVCILSVIIFLSISMFLCTEYCSSSIVLDNTEKRLVRIEKMLGIKDPKISRSKRSKN